MTDESNEFGIGEFGNQFSSGAATDVTTILSDALSQSGVSTSNTAYRAVALSFLNTIYKTILKGRHWKFTNQELFIELDAPYSTGSVVLTDGDHQVLEYVATGGVPQTRWNSNHVGRVFAPTAPDQGAYRINKVLSPNELEILPGFVGTSTAADSGTSYQILNDRFLMDAKIQDIKSITPLGYQEIPPVGLQEFRLRKSRNPTLTGVPRMYTTFSSDPQAGQQTIEFYPNPDKRYGFHIEYNLRITRLEDSETCFTMIPPEHTDVLVLGLRAAIYQDQNNAVMADMVGKEARSAWNRMAGDHTLTDSVARIQPHQGFWRSRRGRFGRGGPTSFGLQWFGKFD